ncbi:hypothetical protein LZ31DRAFT_464472 [Colletotrichum somersetense]|nr:hypothetical protein LZ31DRAFT_464472 [Colletotrichum somersetense]
MGQCVSSGSASASSSGNPDKPNSRCQAPGCQKACDPGSKSRYCAQHGVYTCRVSMCSNEQVRVYDARFTNRLCWDHQPADVREAWFTGTLFPEYGTAGADATDNQQQRTRRRRSRQKPNPTVAEVAPAPVYETPTYISQASPDSDNDDARDVGHQLSTIGEDAEVASPPNRGPRIPRPETAPGTPTARRSQKTVHFAEPPRDSSPPRVSSQEKHQVVTADVWTTADSVRSTSENRLRSSRHRRSVDGRHGIRSSPKTSGSAVGPVTHNREKRRSTGSVPNKPADAKRAPRSRSRP